MNLDEHDVVLCAAGSAPGDLHKLWRTKNSKGFHLSMVILVWDMRFQVGLRKEMADPVESICDMR